ncbi:MAG: hypothetical protein H6R19_3671 [Proteobacteria bacterium]|jgi:hypothetical protein|nr:hypothetical protein [Pseudomonadota bacterium]MBS1211273.1 hypothetical protein [Pseudomonadota bacterium]
MVEAYLFRDNQASGFFHPPYVGSTTQEEV